MAGLLVNLREIRREVREYLGVHRERFSHVSNKIWGVGRRHNRLVESYCRFTPREKTKFFAVVMAIWFLYNDWCNLHSCLNYRLPEHKAIIVNYYALLLYANVRIIWELFHQPLHVTKHVALWLLIYWLSWLSWLYMYFVTGEFHLLPGVVHSVSKAGPYSWLAELCPPGITFLMITTCILTMGTQLEFITSWHQP